MVSLTLEQALLSDYGSSESNNDVFSSWAMNSWHTLCMLESVGALDTGFRALKLDN
jgi:hypothetical protein